MKAYKYFVDIRKNKSTSLNLRKTTSTSLNLKSLSKTHQSSLTLKGGSTAFPKPLSPQGTGDVQTALLGAFFSKTYPSFLTLKEGSTSLSKPLPSQKGKDVPTALLGAQTASLYGWRTIRGLRQQQSCGFLCGDEPALRKSC